LGEPFSSMSGAVRMTVISGEIYVLFIVV
jgi:hypothetical protein